MRTFLTTLRYTILLIWRDKSSVIMLVLFPIALILILGNALGGMMGATEVEPIECSLVSESQALREFLTHEEVSAIIRTTELAEDEARERVKSGEFACAILEENGIITLMIADANSLGSANIIYSVLNGYAGLASAVELRMANGDYGVLQQLDFESAIIERKPLGAKVPEAIDYYAVSMTIMFLIYAGLNMAEQLNRGLFSTQGIRMRITPASKTAYVGGMITAAVLSGVMQSVVLVSVSKFVFGANWSGNPLLIGGALLGMCLLSNTLAMFILLLTKSDKATMGFVQIFAFAATFVSRGFTTYVKFPESLERIFEFSPNALTQRVIFGTIYGSDFNVSLNLGILYGVSAVLFLGSVLLLRRAYK